MFLNIITPCSRPYNLKQIEESINIPNNNYRWIIVFDAVYFPENIYIPKNCEIYILKNNDSIFGNAQRNYALSLIEEGYIYFNDDDTIIHKDLWSNIENITNDVDFISFHQENKDGSKRLFANQIKKNYVDSHNFIFHKNILTDTKFLIELYDADGVFAESIYQKSKKHLIINSVLSTYNFLR